MRHSGFPLAWRLWTVTARSRSMNSFPRRREGRGLAAAFAMEETFAAARPRPRHRALPRLQAGKRLRSYQNIDICTSVIRLQGDDVVELHGNPTYARCTAATCL